MCQQTSVCVSRHQCVSADKGQRVTPPPPWAGKPINQERHSYSPPTHGFTWEGGVGGGGGSVLSVTLIGMGGGGGGNQTSDSKIK